MKNFKCGDCGYSCYLKTDLERHISNVHDKHRSPCGVCGKKYSDLRQHVRIVHEGAKVRLNNNNKIASILWLLVHINLRLSSNKLQYHSFFQAECPHCKGKYSNLSQHIHKVHLKTKNVMCEKCGMTFYHNSNLKKHIETTHAQVKVMATVNNNYLWNNTRQGLNKCKLVNS